jgi:hypothetical protein
MTVLIMPVLWDLEMTTGCDGCVFLSSLVHIIYRYIHQEQLDPQHPILLNWNFREPEYFIKISRGSDLNAISKQKDSFDVYREPSKFRYTNLHHIIEVLTSQINSAPSIR